MDPGDSSPVFCEFFLAEYEHSKANIAMTSLTKEKGEKMWEDLGTMTRLWLRGWLFEEIESEEVGVRIFSTGRNILENPRDIESL